MYVTIVEYNINSNYNKILSHKSPPHNFNARFHRTISTLYFYVGNGVWGICEAWGTVDRTGKECADALDLNTIFCKLFVNLGYEILLIISKTQFMRHATIYVTDNEFTHFLQLAQNLHYVTKIETDTEPTKSEIINNLKIGIEEVQLFKKGELKTTAVKEFLNEL